jgi:heat shock protein HslJ
MSLPYMKKTSVMLQIAAATLLGLSGCAGQPEQTTAPENPPAMPDQLAGINWTAERIFDRDATAARSTMTINADDTVNGNTACNNYQGSLERDGNNISFGMLATTRMMCEPAVSGQETGFLEALGETHAWSQAGSQLDLLDENGTAILRFISNEE